MGTRGAGIHAKEQRTGRQNNEIQAGSRLSTRLGAAFNLCRRAEIQGDRRGIELGAFRKGEESVRGFRDQAIVRRIIKGG